MTRAPYTINFRFVGNAQTGKATRNASVHHSRDARGRFTKLQEMMNTIVEDVALNTADRTYRNAKKSLEESVEKVVAKEISQMAKMIARFSVQPASAFGPKGLVTSGQRVISQQARSLWGNKNVLWYELSQSDANWGRRTSRYLGWKRDNGYPQDWWRMTGELRKALAKESLYKDLGPVKVTFLKTGNTLTGKKVNQTISGRKGSLSATYQVGQLNVQAMGRITPEMLPALMDRLGNGVNDATPHGSSYIPSLFKDKKTRNKLLRFGQAGYRPVVEPFLAYYLTRAIPNAVFNRTEKLISDTSVARANRLGGGVKTSLGFGNQGT